MILDVSREPRAASRELASLDRPSAREFSCVAFVINVYSRMIMTGTRVCSG